MSIPVWVYFYCQGIHLVCDMNPGDEGEKDEH